MLWHSAVSDQANLDVAVHEVCSSLPAAMRDQVDLAVVFVSLHFATVYADVATLLRERIQAHVFIGASAGGVIGGGREVEQHAGLALTVAQLPDVQLHGFGLQGSQLPDLDARPGAWHTALGVQPEPRPQFIVLADPFSFPTDQLLTGLDYAYPGSTKIGGLASGANQPGRNALYLDDQVLRAGAVGVALSGNVAVDTVVAQGCRPIGKPLQITRCETNIIFELDGEPPLEVLQQLATKLSSEDRELMRHSLFLGFVMDELTDAHGPGDYLIRNLMGIDPQRGALAVGEHLRTGQRVQFHLRDARTSAEDLRLVLERFAAQERPVKPQGALLFSCLGRGMYLYGEPDHDSDAFRDIVGPVPLGGFFCNGEIGPVGGSTYLHGYTSSFGIFRSENS